MHNGRNPMDANINIEIKYINEYNILMNKVNLLNTQNLTTIICHL